ncbi:hypothetical protein ABIB40_001440 [Pedobacter sp. UYP30]|uniref:PH domain-containing protein n=1 Tax=Pedobacter sp. UYP30 TaxID=1756400 RepID=UPI00339572C5
MIDIDKFLSDEQDPKAVEKILGKLDDLLISGEELIYIAVQKKPAVNLLPDSIVITNKRIFYCQPSNLGLTMNFKDISWKSIKEVSFKEEIFGAKFICVPTHGENIVTDFIPKVQARKLNQAANEQINSFHESISSKKTEIEPLKEILEPEPEAPQISAPLSAEEEIVRPFIEQTIPEEEDETVLKLRKLKNLFDKHLISQEEYEAKKSNILDSL